MELPRIQQLANEFGKRGIGVITVATMEVVDIPGMTTSLPKTIAEGEAKLRRMVGFNHITIPIGMAKPGNSFRRSYHETAGRTLILDSAGKVVWAGGFDRFLIARMLDSLVLVQSAPGP